MQRKPCTRCLLSDIDQEKLESEIKDYILSIPKSDKADDETYAHRLDICRECESLNEGTCALCGCFCEVRAVKKKSSCPAKKW